MQDLFLVLELGKGDKDNFEDFRDLVQKRFGISSILCDKEDLRKLLE